MKKLKISELTTKEFLSNPGAVANSYVLINYEDNTTEAPVTYKATIDELGKAIANNLQLYKADSSGNAYTMGVSQGAYTNNAAKQFVTAAEKTKIANALTQHQDISGKVDKVTGKGLSTNDYTDAEKLKVANAVTGSMASIAASVAKETITTPPDYYGDTDNLVYTLYEEETGRFWTYDPTLNNGQGNFWPISDWTDNIFNVLPSVTLHDNENNDYTVAMVDSQGTLGYMVYDNEANGATFATIATGGSGSGSSAPPTNCFYVYDPPEGQDDDHLPLELRRSGAASKYLATELVQDVISLHNGYTSAMFVLQDSDGQFYGYGSDCGAAALSEITLPTPYQKVIPAEEYGDADSEYSYVFYASAGCYSCLMTLDEYGDYTAVPPSIYDDYSNGIMQPLYVSTDDEVGYYDEYGVFNEFTISSDSPLSYPIATDPQSPNIISDFDYVFAYGYGSNKKFYTIENSGVATVNLIGTPLFFTLDTTNNKILLKDPDGQTIGQVDYAPVASQT